MNYTYSVAIPHFNSPELLDRMLKSIPERDDIQVIVVDDGSKPENVEKIKNIKHRNLELILLNENMGGGYARNEGLKRSTGKWFISVDSDDFFSKETFDVFDKYKGGDDDVIMFCINICDNEGNVTSHTLKSNDSVLAYLKKKSEKTEKLIRYRNPDTWNKLVSLSFLKKNNINYEMCRINIDALYALQIGLFAKKIKVIPNKLYNWVATDGSITMKKRTVEREFLFFLQAQKRNGFYKQIGLNHWPYYRSLLLYLPFMLKKRGIKDTVSFYKLIYNNWDKVIEARRAYMYLFEK